MVTDMVKHLEKKGVQCWYAPRNIVPGKHYASSILEAIRSSNAFVIVFSKNSNASEQCLKEVDRAVNARKPIIPFRIDETLPTEAMDYYLCNTHWLNAYETVVTNYYDQLTNAVLDFTTVEEEKTEYVTEVKSQDDGLSKELKDVIQTLRDEAIRDEEAVLEFKRKKEELEEKREEEANPTVVKFPQERTKQIISKESKPLVLQAKKKRRKNKEIFEKEESKFDRIKEKIIFPIALVSVAIAMYMYKSMISDNQVKVVKKVEKSKKIDKVKNTSEAKKEEGPDYRKVPLNKEQIETMSVEELKKIKNVIKHRDGNLFERTREGLVEKSWTEVEIQNYFLLNYIITEKSRPQVKGMTSRIFLNHEVEEAVSPMQEKLLWETSEVLIKETLYDDDLDVAMLRLYPGGHMARLPVSGELVISTKFVRSSERKLIIYYTPGLEVSRAVDQLTSYLTNINLDYELKEHDSKYDAKELLLVYQGEYLGDDGFKGFCVQIVDFARYFIKSIDLIQSI